MGGTVGEESAIPLIHKHSRKKLAANYWSIEKK
jgi:hypothetical protein